MTENDDAREFALLRIDDAQEATRLLPMDGPVRAVLTDHYIDEVREWVRGEGDLDNVLWPPLLLYAMSPWHTPEQLQLLDSDVRSIRDHRSSDSAAAVRWLAAGRDEGRLWRGGYFETCVRAKALAAANDHSEWSVEFDVPLPNGRNVDIVLRTGDRSYFLECTVITESDEDQEVHAAWMAARRAGEDIPLARPGVFDPPGSKGPSPYYDANRFYIKVFDKLQRYGDPTRAQTSDDDPSLLLLSCFPVYGSPLPFSPALRWAFDELFVGQPNMGSLKQMPRGSSIRDISLHAFLNGLWPATAIDLLQSPSRLSGVLIFNCVGLQSGRINYNARAPQQLTHLEMAVLEGIFTPLRGWEKLVDATDRNGL